VGSVVRAVCASASTTPLNRHPRLEDHVVPDPPLYGQGETFLPILIVTSAMLPVMLLMVRFGSDTAEGADSVPLVVHR
jgi:hypothetical protein